jgi:tetraacyldisaccharide 4'-kinase
MKRANMIICTKCPSEVTPIMRNILKKEAELKPYQELFFTTFSYGPLKPVFPDFIQENDEIITKKIPLLVVTGIASPGPLYEELEKRGYPLEKLAFPDHRRFTTDDFQTIIRTFEKINSEKKYIITTAKDAVRMRDSKVLPSGLRSVLWYIDVKVTFLDNEEKHFNTRIFNYVGENKGNRELYHRQD